MDAFLITGGTPLQGTLRVNGSKNAALPLLAATLMTDEAVTLEEVPRLADIRNMVSLLQRLGSSTATTSGEEGDSITLEVTDPAVSTAPYEVVRTMRASICVLGPMLAKRGEARISLPGGCAIGDRPIDLHLKGLEALGARITLEEGDVVARVPQSGRLIGARLFLGGPFGPTVLGTANIMCAAALAEGTTVIEGAACEPEIVDVAKLLTAMGADIEGAGSPRITVRGVESLGGAVHRVMPDRIEAGTFAIAAGITNGKLRLTNYPSDVLMAASATLDEIGIHAQVVDGGDGLRSTVDITADRILRPTRVTTHPHPGFPTDLQAQLMALLCLTSGNSVVTERIFEQRFLHVAELTRMGGQLFRQGPTVVVSGVRELVGAQVMASDLRASACLVLAGMAAKGETAIRRVYHLDRGYERLEQRLGTVGAQIRRVPESELPAD